MFPVKHVVCAAIGALIGGNIGQGGGWFFTALVGAFIGFAMAEFSTLRGRTLSLEEELGRLRAAREPQRPDAPAAVPTSAEATVAAESPQAVLEEWRHEELDVEESPPLDMHDRPLSAPSPAHSPPPAPQAMLEPHALHDAPADASIVEAIHGFLTGGNTVVRAGVIVLFFGVAFLLRYVAEHSRVPIEFRLAGVALGAIVLLVLGWRLRKSRAGYALALQGCAVGILYLTIFAALHLYALLPAALAFGVLAVLAALSAILAVLQNSQAFALLAITGAFLAPLLASKGDGNHIVLFGYYAVVNAAIVAIAWFKSWRPLNLAGFAFTFIIGTAWGVLRYRPADFSTTEPFLILFFLFYVAAAVLFTLRQPANLRGYVDGTLVFALPIVAFGLQSAMLHDRLFSLAYSAVAVSALYLILAWLLHRVRNEGSRVLVEAFMALGVAFLTLAVPLALDNRWNAATWALEGSAMIWVGCRQQRRVPRAFGAALIVAAGCVLAPEFSIERDLLMLRSSAYFGTLTVSAAALFAAQTLHRSRQRLKFYESVFAPALFLWGLLWWWLGGIGEIGRIPASAYVPAAILGFAALTALSASEFHRRADLPIARAAALFLMPAMLLCALYASRATPHPFARGGWIAWPAAFAVFYVLAHRHEGAREGGVAKALHVASAWLLCALLSWELAWTISANLHGSAAWPAVAWAMVAALAVSTLPYLVTRVDWPFRAHREAYLFTAGAGLAMYLGLWSLTTNLTLHGDADPLPYVPLLNPLDIAQAFVFVVILRYWRFLRAVHLQAFAGLSPALLPACLAGLAFIWANAALLRTLHQWGSVAFSLESFTHSTLVQTSLSIFWAVLAFATMLFATRKSIRIAWLAGAALLAVVVAKLFLVDLSRIGSIERIVSFLGVGGLMLIVGYLSPLPPAVEPRR